MSARMKVYYLIHPFDKRQFDFMGVKYNKNANVSVMD